MSRHSRDDAAQCANAPRDPSLALIVYESATGSVAQAALRAAVHAWYEGHIAGEGDRVPAKASTEAMPAPPFPSRNDPLIRDIVSETTELFSSDELVAAAAAHAAALGYAAGYAEGKSCGGCSYRGQNPAKAASVRAGEIPITLSHGVATHGGPLPAAADIEGEAILQLARRLAAAWVSSSLGLRAMDHTFKGMKDETIGEYWKGLAAMVTRDMQGAMSHMHPEDEADENH